ncbi:hypothetical protein EL22_16995 [Halostagnicola sp. A56]|uniref:HK97 gp10 family phage protein n=1 Tax=Halostagnicola sp. A56 TaxID=1495067 RepID=UPI0004A167B6|nr:HK97 gp10 family phage protein [Halostagnicola sp. A56]KDE59823.1 hypothetical protein EL22_16995 [Halostagnicola sp. A56]
MTLEFEWQTGNTPGEMQDALREFAEILEEELLNEFEDLMETLRKRVQGLAPVDTGKLKSSYEEDVEKLTGEIEGTVETDVEYAPFQEFLEYGKSHLGPAFEGAKPLLETHVEKAWERAVREVS